MTPMYLEDLAAGQKYGSQEITVDAEGIKSFAKEYDPQPFHLDERSAAGTFFGGLVASGWQTASQAGRARQGRDPSPLKLHRELLNRPPLSNGKDSYRTRSKQPRWILVDRYDAPTAPNRRLM